MLELNFNPFPTLTTDRLVLRQLDKTDADEMFFLRSNERVMKYLDRAPAKSVDEAVAFIQMINTAIANNESINWAITLKGEPKIIGDICFWRMDSPNHRAEIGYRLHPAHHGKGIMNEALHSVLDYGFNVMNLHSVEANTNPGNKESIRLLERNGFIREGYFKENYFYNGKFLDSAVYSLVRPIP